jgi:hypothetical protein
MQTQLKIYLGGPMFKKAEVEYNLRLAEKLRNLGFLVYCPNENDSINDKTRTDITPEKVYDADRIELESSNIFLCQVAEDSGTMWESGYMDCLHRYVDDKKYLGTIGYASDIRLHTPPNPLQEGVYNQAWGINAFIIGGLLLSLGVFIAEEDLLAKLQLIADAN